MANKKEIRLILFAQSGQGSTLPRLLFSAFLFLFMTAGYLLLINIAPVSAGDLPFTDSRWKTFDCDYSDNTDFTISNAAEISITAAGQDVWTGADQYAAYYLEDINGNFEATVKITYQENTNEWAKAGIIVRNDMDLNGADHNGDGYCVISVTPGNGYAFQYDNNDNGFLDHNSNTGSSSYSVWLKLEKEDSTYTGYYSTDGSSWTEVHSKNFSSVKSIQDVGIFVTSHSDENDCTVDFESFAINNLPVPTSFMITPSAGSNGNISPSSGITVSEGDSRTFTVAPDAGYQADTFLVDDLPDTLTGNQYTFANVDQDHTLSVTFTPLTYTVTAASGENGSISPSGSVTVPCNGSQTFTVTPDPGYEVSTLYVDDAAATLTNDAYTFSGVTSDHTVSVTFAQLSVSSGDDGIPGCADNTFNDYSSGFDANDFDFQNIEVENGVIRLQTGNDAIDPDNIVIPFEQEVAVTFLLEGAGYVSDFGWMLKSDAVDTSGNFLGWNSIPRSSKHPLFHNIYDDDEGSGCCNGGNGIFDSDYANGIFPASDETALAAYDDGTGYAFMVDGDGSVTPKDMRKSLGTFAAGTEIVFFLTADKDWDTDDENSVFFTKKEWNPDTYGACGSGTFDKVYNLSTASSEGSCTTSGGWLTQPVISRLSSVFGVTLSGSYNLPIVYGDKFSHVIVGAPEDDPDQWILGWEDLAGGGDADHNDMVFRIERRTGGTAQLKSTEAIVPESADAYFTAANFEVWDNMPCDGDTEIDYYVSIDNGENWVEIDEWDQVFLSDADKSIIGSGVTGWTYGHPQYTYRSRRIDFAGRGLAGRALIWKAEIYSDKADCIPSILDVNITGNVASHGNFSRSAPIVVGNVIYSGYYETPSMDWTEKVQRGHLSATRIYDPSDPEQTSEMLLWDAGSVLSSSGSSPDNRTIYFPSITVSPVTDEVVGTDDASGTTTFSGTLAHAPVSATTVRITNQTETFTDIHTEELKGDKGGSGTINRFTGDFTLIFDAAPGDGVAIVADYSYYTASGVSEFTTTNITSEMLGLDDTYIIPDGFKYDFNGDGKYNNLAHDGSGTFDDSDGDWLVEWVRGWSDGTTKADRKDWLLGPIDHSVPAVITPPGNPSWYYGSDITTTDKEGYDIFRETYADRQSVVFVGARDGMLHAFDAGRFRWGDNPDTGDVTEMRGYYLWEEGVPQYGSGAELWAFIPANLLPRLKNNLLSGDDQAYVDASPALADVYVNGSWRTILLCAQGNGGDTIFCLDVTSPVSPSFMWEFSDPDLYRSRSSPSVGRIGRIVDKDGNIKWVAFFVSGKTYDTALYPSIYMINIADGSVAERIELNAEPNGIGGVPSGQPSILDSDDNGYIDRAYIGTNKGYLYKVNIPDDPGNPGTITQCVINKDFETDAGDTVPLSQRYQPIYASPTVLVEKTPSSTGQIDYHIRIFFGTGDSPYYDEDINTSETTYHFFAYVDECGKGVCDQDSTYLDWYYELEAGHRVFASAAAAAGVVYFGTSTAETEDPCESSNEGEIIALNIEDGSLRHKEQVGNIVTPLLVRDKHLYIRKPGGLISIGEGKYNNAMNMGGNTSITTLRWREIF